MTEFVIGRMYKVVKCEEEIYLNQVGRLKSKGGVDYVHLIIETVPDWDPTDETWYRDDPRRISFLLHSAGNEFVDVTNKCEDCLKEALYRALRGDGKNVCEWCIEGGKN